MRDQLKALDAVNFERTPPNLKQVVINTGYYTGVEPLQEALVRDVQGPLYPEMAMQMTAPWKPQHGFHKPQHGFHGAWESHKEREIPRFAKPGLDQAAAMQ